MSLIKKALAHKAVIAAGWALGRTATSTATVVDSS